MKSTNIEDYIDVGLNADWCVSTYQLAPNVFIFDNENGTYTLSLVDVDNSGHEEAYNNFHTGTFKECVDLYNENQRD